MLRTALPSGRRKLHRCTEVTIRSQWLASRPLNPIYQVTTLKAMLHFNTNEKAKRSLADSRGPDSNTKPSIKDSDTAVLPGSASKIAKGPTPPPPRPVPPILPGGPTPVTPVAEKIITPEKVPLVPPPPPGGKTQTSPPTTLPKSKPQLATPGQPTSPPSSSISSPSATSSPPPPPPPKKKRGRFRRFLLYLFLLGGFTFAGGVYYSLLSDNFHDFFTEYIPFGEDAVLFFEEREFRKRFPRLTNPTNRPPPPGSGDKITIPSRSGLSWKVADVDDHGSDSATKGTQRSALDKPKPKSTTEISEAQRSPAAATSREKTTAVEKAKKNAAPVSSKPAAAGDKPKVPLATVESQPKAATDKPRVENPAPAKEAEKAAPKPLVKENEKAQKLSDRPPEVNEPNRLMPIPSIDPLKINNAEEPLVQDLVKIVNDIITVVNADNASGKFYSSIEKAKSQLAGVGKRILDLKRAEQQAADEKIKATESEFDSAAKELVRRLENALKENEARWRDEFESEREKIAESYQKKLELELKGTREVSEQRLRNELLQKEIALKNEFTSSVKDRVESERGGRLAKLSDLASSVAELEGLTSEWNKLVEANLDTQHLQVAVEAVRAGLETADGPRPFIHELAAVKELAAGDPVVNAAIASISPSAYQRGVPTMAQLIDRFRRVASEVQKASLVPEDAGVASHAASWAFSQLLFKKRGVTTGDDVESILTRAEALLEEGDLDGAAREMNGLDGWAKKLSTDWIAEARRVLEVRQAVDVIATEARLRGLGVFDGSGSS